MDAPSHITFADYWKTTRERVDAGFDGLMPRFFDGQPASVLAAIDGVLAGGKRLRACLVCLLNDALGGAPEAAIPRALAVECVQAASLIHDDLVDGDTVRRNRAATWTVEGPRRAVLLGDLIFATALQRMAQLGRDDALALGDAIATMATGAYQEPLASTDLAQYLAVDPARFYPRLIHLKTGVLFGTAARLGALAAGASAPLASIAFAYGARMGEAYQMADDLQDLVLAADGPPDEAQLPVLAPALWYFCAETRSSGLGAMVTPAHAERLRPRLRDGLLAAIEARLREAVSAAGQLPCGSYRGLLQAAAHDAVQAMRAGAR